MKLDRECVASNKRLVSIVVAVYLIAVAVINSYDYMIFKNWVVLADRYGVTGIYKGWRMLGEEYRVVYPPLAPLLFIYSYKLYTLIASLAGVSSVLLERIIVKAPILAALIIHAWIVYRVYGCRSSVLLLAGPPVLIVVAAYDFEAVLGLFLILALLAHSRGRYAASGGLLALSALVKPVSAFILPFLMASAGRRGAVRLLASYTLVSLAVLAPFAASSGLDSIVESISLYHVARPSQGPTLPGLLWSVYSGHSILFTVGSIAVILVVSLFLARRSSGELDDLLVSSALILSIALLVGKVANPVYIYWVYILALPVAVKRGLDSRFIIVSTLLFIVVEMWYFMPFTVSAILDKPYIDEETGRVLDPADIDNIINESISVITSTINVDAGIHDTRIIRDVAVGIEAISPVIRLILHILYLALILAMIRILVKVRGGYHGG